MGKKVRNVAISAFCVLWLALFQYESLRYQFLSQLLHRPFPKVKFLYPPAGWIMFFRVADYEVRAEVYGQKGDTLELIDPHRIFETRWLGYDNIHRNVLVSILDSGGNEGFCRYLKRKFPEYEDFTVAQVIYGCRPDLRNKAVSREPVYRC